LLGFVKCKVVCLVVLLRIEGIKTEQRTISQQIASYQDEMTQPLTLTLSDNERSELNSLTEQIQQCAVLVESKKTERAVAETAVDAVRVRLSESLRKSKEDVEERLRALHTTSKRVRSNSENARLEQEANKGKRKVSHGKKRESGDPKQFEHDEYDHGETLSALSFEELKATLLDLHLEQDQLVISLVAATEAFSQIEKSIQQRSKECDESERAVESLRDTERERVQRLAILTQTLDKLLNRRSMALETIQSKQRAIRDLGALPRKELDDCDNLIKSIPARKRRASGTTSVDEREVERLERDMDAIRDMLTTRLKIVNDELKDYSAVNRKALDQFLSFSEQRVSLIERKSELDRDTKAIEKLIMSLDAQKDEAILRTFRSVNKEFSECFAELVPGGSARLILRTRVGDGDKEVLEGEEMADLADNTILDEKVDGETEEESEIESDGNEGEDAEDLRPKRKQSNKKSSKRGRSSSSSGKRTSKGKTSSSSSRKRQILPSMSRFVMSFAAHFQFF
jgi:structural maintenance of chromosome 3 (chondroitin sulfate proteoglycan 6)